MKIIYIHPIFGVYGGAEKVLLDLFRRTKRDFKCEMYTLFNADYLKEEEGIYYGIDKNPPLKSIFGYKANPFNRRIIKRLGLLLAKNYEEGDVIMLTNFPSTLILDEAIKANQIIAKGNNYLFSLEPDRILYYKNLKKLGYLPEDIKSIKMKLASIIFSSWRRRDYSVVQKYITKILTLSDYVTEQTKAIYLDKIVEKSTELYVDLKSFKIKSKGDSRNKIESQYHLGINKDDIIILSQSRVEKSKGILELINAVKSLNREGKYSNIKLLIGGKGSLFEKVKKCTEKERNIFALGFIPNELLPHLYGASDIFVALPRKETGGPLTVLEGMYAKSIVIGSNEGGPPELINNGKTGFLVSPDSDSEISSAIKIACDIIMGDQKKHKKMTEDAKKRVEKNFTFEVFYRRLIRALTAGRTK